MPKPLLLDLFCCAGGAAKGYANAGFDVVGVDIEPQPRYPYPFLQMDAVEALDRLLNGESLDFGGTLHSLKCFAAIHASPPCQAHSDLQKQSKIEYEDFIEPTRNRLRAAGLPFVIENVEGAPLIDPVKLCGANNTIFPELRVIRHRLFESNVTLVGAPCPKKHPLVFTFDKRKPHFGRLDQDTAYVQVTGGGNCSMKNAGEAMGIDWMRKKELNESLPPAYTHWLGMQLMQHI